MAVIEVQNLTKRFGPTLAVDHLSFEVPQGTITGFLGPNGAGKTTTLRMLLGLVTPSSGRALIEGRPYVELDHPLRHVGAVLESSSFYPGRRARDHLRILAMTAGVSGRRVEEVLELVGLAGDADRRVGGFSLGMRQRLGLAGALLAEPGILVLDEPANGLDPEGVRWLRELLRRLRSEGRTILVSSHILAEVSQIADGVVILDRGRLVTQGSLEALTAGDRRVVHVRTPRAAELLAALEGAGMRGSLGPGDRLEVRGASPEQVGVLAASLGIPIFESRAEEASLEDVFFELTAAEERGANR
ncbi:MAG TPA: ATP-binding cassette domain-containing protein [Acidimicrobiales bacterium]|nr:ATP-binding cassette domain-containing protein [Acidimicrobiales bacterium]